MRLSCQSSILNYYNACPLSDEKAEAIIDATAKSAKTRGLVTSFALVEADNAVQIAADFGIKKYPSSVLVVCHRGCFSKMCEYNLYST